MGSKIVPNLSFAYAKKLIEDQYNNLNYNLDGSAIGQHKLTDKIDTIYNPSLNHDEMGVSDFCDDRKKSWENSMVKLSVEFMRSFKKANGRKHKSPDEMIIEFKE